MHDGNCNNCNGGLSAQNSILALAAIVGAVDVAIIALRPHESNVELITLIDTVLAPLIAQMIGVNKTQEVHKALCETAKVNNDKNEEIHQIALQDLAATTEVKEALAKSVIVQDKMVTTLDTKS